MARADFILDSSVVIDLILQNPAALNWSRTVQRFQGAVTPIVIMEVLKGAQNKREMDWLGREISRFVQLPLLKQDSEWAVRQFRDFWLSHQIGINDCLIAAIAARTQLPLYTVNIRDFEPLPDVDAHQPY